MQVLILAGGLGSRVSHLENVSQKCMIKFSEKPFLEYLINNLVNCGLIDITLLLGYKSEEIIDHFRDGSEYFANISYSIENEQLGTAGAVKNAEQNIKSDYFILMNGDTYLTVDYRKFILKFNNKDFDLGICIIDSNNLSMKDFAGIEVDNKGKVISYNEKSTGSYASCGLYFFKKNILDYLDYGKTASIEYDFIPSLITNKKIILTYNHNGSFFDIGTENRIKTFSKHIVSI